MTAPSLRDRRREKRVQELLGIALEVFAEQGVPGAAIEDIARRALLTRAAFYRYFPDKLSLLRALRVWKLGELARQVGDVVDAEPEPGRRLGRLIEESLEFQQEQEAFFRVFFTSGVSPEALGDDALGPYLALVERELRAEHAAGRLGEWPLDRLAALLTALVFTPSIARSFVKGGERHPPADEAALVERLFRHGAGPGPARGVRAGARGP
ncbi:hypothetical protein DAETH_38220 (plasmid) [Deinococcus aetherius]|uniref:HTH tetR-type domain-containing protein n=1 Tax=Deinococcus aetherius TaxID=200252 RepID=A0ABN6RPS9_9DEIO|nr:TetR/AcrR family transcriptional regulator [Deinococcus aetherius]BDP43853.1 hypothetical protein DAETH_38220 [Deinococcus aetherius]